MKKTFTRVVGICFSKYSLCLVNTGKEDEEEGT